VEEGVHGYQVEENEMGREEWGRGCWKCIVVELGISTLIINSDLQVFLKGCAGKQL
jgi:hypothetical protein